VLACLPLCRWCSPFIIASFNTGDLIGRSVAHWGPLQRLFTDRWCLWGSILRTLFVLIIPTRHSIDNYLLLVLVMLLALSNGFLCTVSIMNGAQRMKTEAQKERASYVMTTALYAGIAFGSITAATLDLTGALD
jgi:hypothetical protein